jgi:hypothetical protein
MTIPATPPPGPPVPPFCTLASDRLPMGPPCGSPENHALAAWEVLTGARVARSTGSGRMSRLAGFARQEEALTRDRILRIALHAFDGAEARWSCRRARWPAMTDRQVIAAVIQEMGGPATDPAEMTTLGFWHGDVGFYFDCRGPCVVITGAGTEPHRLGPGALVAAARRLLGLSRAAPSPCTLASSESRGHVPEAPEAEQVQLSLL